ncbi:MAG TPA: hypothetical protein VGO67_16215 [Verrucomicrobiae bacterium]
MNSDAPKRRRLLWLFKGPWWWRAWLGLMGIIVLVSAFYAEEDWRGQHSWDTYRKSMEAAGISLDLQTYTPKPVPDDENFAMSPIPKKWMNSLSLPLTNDLYSRASDYVWATNSSKNAGHRHFEDLVAWQQAFAALKNGSLNQNGASPKTKPQFWSLKFDLASRAQAAPSVLEGMKPDEAEFAELRQASTLPYSRFPIIYRMDDPAQTLLPHLAKVKQVCQHLHLQTCAELASGQTDKALADVKLSLYLTDSVKTEPFLISFLVQSACFQIVTQSVWEGLAERRWTDAQLQELETSFGRYDFLREGWDALTSERAFGIREIDVVRKRGLGSIEDMVYGQDDPARKAFLNVLGEAMPEGWFDLEKVNYCNLYDEQITRDLNPAEKRVFPTQLSSNDVDFALSFAPGSFAPGAILRHKLFAPWLNIERTFPDKIAIPQTVANQAAIACALERYRLAKGQFPETLFSLTPQFIERVPTDVITGEPYKYRRTAGGQFVLYSVGWNGKDDGGVPGKRLFDESEGDWVWEYPVQ